MTAEKLTVGYWKSILLFSGLIAITYLAHRLWKLGPITAFWIAYILTRPLGASIGDYLSQPRIPDPQALKAGDLGPADVGLALGTTITSIIFLVLILLVVVYLTITKKDEIHLDRVDDLHCPHCPEEGHPVPGKAPVDGHQEYVCLNGHHFTWDIHNGEIVELLE